ncbi:hypothetical protein [Blastopirellula marina]|uniref:Uncharacterized protein n=1 Tax=Blastopirellula marina TaxID=124 RepID=A0A2S8GC45_9BACT|nr:hypothetical protein [Blastopirellula marina]PQO42036.1 hypothetical protein C5Y93_27145 [Blastopirellula marina]
MPEADIIVRVLQGVVIVLTILGIAKLFCLIGLMSKMFDLGDTFWGWFTGGTALLGIIDHAVGKWIPGSGLILEILAMPGTITVLIVGWIRHRRYNATRRMIVLSILVAFEVLTYLAFFVGVVLFFATLRPAEG